MILAETKLQGLEVELAVSTQNLLSATTSLVLDEF